MTKTAECLWVAIKIWLFAVLFHTIIGTIILSANASDLLPLIFLYGALIGGIFSLPIIFIVFALLMIISRKKYSFTTSMIIICATGIIAALLASWVFYKNFGTDGFNFLYITATLSGGIAILIQTNSIRKLTQTNNLIDELLKSEKNETDLV